MLAADRIRPRSGVLYRVLGLALALPVLALAMATAEAAADEKKEKVEASRDWLGGIPVAPTEDWMIAFGGRIYDNWYNALDKDEPTVTHPSYPKEGHKKGAATWRCKECHGWDYKGTDGVYAKGSHYTGIKGLAHLVGADLNLIKTKVRDEVHQITPEMIPDNALEGLALFVTRGQHEIDWYVDIASKRAKGDAARGERVFQNVCAPCHGFDGRAINFKTEPALEYIGTVASKAPWEALHKIRNGQPGQPMPVLRVLTMQHAVDILAYSQTLPKK